MEQQVKTKVQFTDDYNAFTNLENNDSLSTGFGKMHYDLGYLNSEDQRQESEINAIAQAGSKNICPIGTETHSSEIGFGTEYSFPMPEGAYILSFTGTMVAPIQFNVYSESGTRIALVDIHTIQEAEAGIRFVLNDNATKCKFWYDTSDNYTLSNIMIRDANITDNTFQPYSPTNRELYEGLENKQDNIPDLNTIRSGAAAGATALQQSDVSSTYSASGTAPVNGTAVNAAIETLDVSSVGGSGKYISAIYEENGKIEATPTTFDTGLSSSSTNGNAPTSKCVYDDQERQEVEIGVVANAGAKNLFDINAAPIKYHTTFTLTGGVLSGTSNGDWASYNVPVNLLAGDYTFSAVISNFSRDSGAGEGTIRIRITNSVSGGTAIGTTNITGNGAISIPFSWSGGQLYIQYSFNFSSTESYVNSFTASNSMIRPASITDSTFQPYALPNPTLTPALIEQVDEGAKNLLKIVATSQSYDDGKITFTVNADQTVTVNATNNHTQQSLVLAYLGQEFYGKTVVISGCPAGGNFSTGYYLLIYKASGSTTIAYDIGYSVTLTIPNEDCRIAIGVRANVVLNNLIFKPMICTAADWAVSQKFVPYRPSWQEMAEKTAQIGLKLVKSQTVTSNTEVTYAMDKNDFLESSPNIERSIGTYVISIMPWSTSPNFSLYTVSYTGGTFTYTSIVKIAGVDRTVTVSGGVISISGFPSAGAKVSIHAML